VNFATPTQGRQAAAGEGTATQPPPGSAKSHVEPVAENRSGRVLIRSHFRNNELPI
jgi:hypothetical protein